MIIAPSILSADPMRFAEEILEIEKLGADWHHVDVMDGHFVPPLTFGLPIVESLRKCSEIPLDVHIMVSNPLEVAPMYVRAGAHRVTFHIEATKRPLDVIEAIRHVGGEVGIALNPGTPVKAIADVLDLVDHVLVMSVNPGYAGQGFIFDVLEKIEWLSSKDIPIIVDGGIKPDTAKLVKAKGAHGVVAGSWIYNAKDRKQALEALKEI